MAVTYTTYIILAVEHGGTASIIMFKLKHYTLLSLQQFNNHRKQPSHLCLQWTYKLDSLDFRKIFNTSATAAISTNEDVELRSKQPNAVVHQNPRNRSINININVEACSKEIRLQSYNKE